MCLQLVQNTWKRSALRITRETELLGGEYSSYHSRENLIIGAKFLRDDLPYFAELIGEVLSQTKYTGRRSSDQSRKASELTFYKHMSFTKKLCQIWSFRVRNYLARLRSLP